MAVSNKRLRDRIFREVQNVMSVFQANACMQAAANRRKKQEAAARFIAEARESINYSDDDTPPHNEFNDVLDEICAEIGWLKLVAILISHAQHFSQGRLKGSNIIIPDDEAWMFCYLLSVTVRCSWVSSK